MNLLQDMYVYSSEKDAYRTAFKFADVTGMGYLPFEKARDALTTAGIHVDASKVRIKNRNAASQHIGLFREVFLPCACACSCSCACLCVHSFLRL